MPGSVVNPSESKDLASKASETDIEQLLELLSRASYIIWEELGQGSGTYYGKWQNDYEAFLNKLRAG